MSRSAPSPGPLTPNPCHAVALFVAALLLTACTPRQGNDPLAKMLDREADPTHRLVAAVQARRQLADDPTRIAALNELVWHLGHPDALRIEAVDQLIEHDDVAFRRNLSRKIGRVQDWQVLEHIFDQVVARQWRDVTSTIVRHYALKAYGFTDQQRPERRVIAQLNPGKSVEQVVFEIFADADGTVPVTHRVAAWHLLARLHGPGQGRLLELLAQAPATTPLVIDLQSAATELHVLPTNREGIVWLSYLRDRSQSAYWQAARARVAQLTPEQRRGLALRHLAPLLLADESILAESRTGLVARLGRRIAAFETVADRLAWADLLTLDLLWQALHSPPVVAALFGQADADLLDTASEHGGVLHGGPQQWRVTSYQPTLRRHDRQFVPPNEMIRHLYAAALGHYHFHAQTHHNQDFARPGGGDLKTAARLHFNFLVCTFIDRDQLNIDYYQPGGIAIDLGSIQR